MWGTNLLHRSSCLFGNPKPERFVSCFCSWSLPDCCWVLFLTRENLSQFAETKARSMEEEISKLQKCLNDKDEQLRSSTGCTEQVWTASVLLFVKLKHFLLNHFGAMGSLLMVMSLWPCFYWFCIYKLEMILCALICQAMFLIMGINLFCHQICYPRLIMIWPLDLVSS